MSHLHRSRRPFSATNVKERFAELGELTVPFTRRVDFLGGLLRDLRTDPGNPEKRKAVEELLDQNRPQFIQDFAEFRVALNEALSPRRLAYLTDIKHKTLMLLAALITEGIAPKGKLKVAFLSVLGDEGAKLFENLPAAVAYAREDLKKKDRWDHNAGMNKPLDRVARGEPPLKPAQRQGLSMTLASFLMKVGHSYNVPGTPSAKMHTFLRSANTAIKGGCLTVKEQAEMEDRNEAYKALVREAALARWDLTFEKNYGRGGSQSTHDPELIARYLQKRGVKKEIIKETLAELTEQAVEYDFIAEKLEDSSALKEAMSEQEIQQWKMRCRLHVLLDDEELTREQAARKLMAEGFNLLELDFAENYIKELVPVYRQREFVKQLQGHGTGRTVFKMDVLKEIAASSNEVSPELREEMEWVEKFTEMLKAGTLPAEETPSPASAAVEAEEPEEEAEEDETEEFEREPQDPEKWFARAALGLKKYISGEETHDFPMPETIPAMLAFFEDGAKLNLDLKDQTQSKIWDTMRNPLGHIQDLRCAGTGDETYEEFRYAAWALKNPETSKRMSQAFKEHIFACLVAGNIVLGWSEEAAGTLADPEIQGFRNEAKVKGAVHLAWRTLHTHARYGGEDEEFKTPHVTLLRTADRFGAYLQGLPSAQKYLALLKSDIPEVLPWEQEIFDNCLDLELLSRIYERRGLSAKMAAHCIDALQVAFERSTRYLSLHSSIAPLVTVTSQPAFEAAVSEGALGVWVESAVANLLSRQNRHNPDEDEDGAREFILRMYLHPVFRPHLEGKIDVREFVNRLIDDSLCWFEKDVLHGELENGSDLFERGCLEKYLIVDRYRDLVEPQRLQELVAWVIASNCYVTAGGGSRLESRLMQEAVKEEMPGMPQPDFLPQEEANDKVAYSITLASNIYKRELEKGGLNKEMLGRALGNLLYHAGIIRHEVFYPQVDVMMQILASPMAECLPKSGPVAEAIADYRILHEFLAA